MQCVVDAVSCGEMMTRRTDLAAALAIARSTTAVRTTSLSAGRSPPNPGTIISLNRTDPIQPGNIVYANKKWPPLSRHRRRRCRHADRRADPAQHLLPPAHALSDR